MPRIGSFSFTVWKGFITDANPEYRRTRRTGVNGRGAVFDAWQVPDFTITTGEAIDEKQLTTRINEYRNLIWPISRKSTTLVNQFGETYDRVMVLAFRSRYWPRVTDANWWLECEWDLTRSPTPPTTQ